MPATELSAIDFEASLNCQKVRRGTWWLYLDCDRGTVYAYRKGGFGGVRAVKRCPMRKGTSLYEDVQEQEDKIHVR